MSITIFNSETKVWNVQEAQNKKGFVISNEHRQTPVGGKRISLHVNAEKYAEFLDTSVLENIGSPWAVFSKGCKVRYDDKHMKPYAVATDPGRGDSIIAVALDIKPGYKLTSFYNSHARVYDISMDVNSHVDFIANMTKHNPAASNFNLRISITLLNEAEQKVITYSISLGRNDKLNVSTKELNVADIPAKGEKGHISTLDFAAKAVENGKEIVPLFHPSSPTALVVTSALCKEDAIKTITDRSKWKKITKYRIETVDDETLLKKFVDEGYTAITLFINNDITVETASLINNSIATTALYAFDTVYYIGKNGFVYKAKVDGLVRK